MPAFLAPLVGAIATGAATGLVGGLLGSGDKPDIPPFVPVDPDSEQAAAIAGNLKNLPAAQTLTTATNVYNQQELRRMLRVAIPGYDDIVGKGSGLIQSFLGGEIPKDVVAQIQRNAAERSGAGGYGGTGMARNLEARDLGLTSLQLTQQGLDSASRWLAGIKNVGVPEQMSVSSMFLTPQQRISVTSANNAQRYQRDLLATNVAAAPDPTQAAIGNILTQIGGSLFGAGLTKAFSQPSNPGPETDPNSGTIWNFATTPD
jgi:hypothetical protein